MTGDDLPGQKQHIRNVCPDSGSGEGFIPLTVEGLPMGCSEKHVSRSRA